MSAWLINNRLSLNFGKTNEFKTVIVLPVDYKVEQKLKWRTIKCLTRASNLVYVIPRVKGSGRIQIENGDS